jgi:hypothetical protein
MGFPDGREVRMNLWMKGYPGREIFTIKAPPCKAYRADSGLPYAVDREPYLTIAARQHGPAWNAPFVAVFEPTDGEAASSIASIGSFTPDGAPEGFVGLRVESISGRVDHIFSSPTPQTVSHAGMTADAAYALVADEGTDFTLFMGNGRLLQAMGYTISAEQNTDAVLEYRNGEYLFTCKSPAVIRTPYGKEIKSLF